MSEVKIAIRYAKALLAKANEENITDKVSKDMNAFVQLCKDSSEFNTLLKSPIVKAADKLTAIKKICSSFDSTTISFFNLVSDKNRTELLEKIAVQYLLLNNTRNGIIEATVTSSVALTSDYENEIVSYIKKNSNAKEVLLKKVVNEEIIGGLIIRFGDYLLDNSISTQLNNLKKELNIA